MHSVIYKQYFVKLYIKPFITLFGIILLTFSTLSTFAAKDTDSLKKIVTEFGAGVNISHFEQYWKSPEEIYKTDINEKIKTIADKGFKTIRLPVSFDLFLQPNSNYIQNDLIKRLKDILILTYGLQIKLIITYHYGKLNENNCETGEVDRIVDMWKQIQFVFLKKPNRPHVCHEYYLIYTQGKQNDHSYRYPHCAQWLHLYRKSYH